MQIFLTTKSWEARMNKGLIEENLMWKMENWNKNLLFDTTCAPKRSSSVQRLVLVQKSMLIFQVSALILRFKTRTYLSEADAPNSLKAPYYWVHNFARWSIAHRFFSTYRLFDNFQNKSLVALCFELRVWIPAAHPSPLQPSIIPFRINLEEVAQCDYTGKLIFRNLDSVPSIRKSWCWRI